MDRVGMECPMGQYQTSTINVIGAPKGEENNWAEKILEETMTKFFPNIVNSYKHISKKLNRP